MAKLKSQRMQPVNQFAEKLEKEGAVEYSKCQSMVRELELQLEKMYQYREGYNQQLITMSKTGVGSHRLQDTLVFMNNLNASIEGLLKQIQQQKQICEQKKQQWLALHNKKRIYHKVTEKFLTEEQTLRNKHEQKMLDDYNQALFHRKLNQPQD
jgi:flagellar FliJ protein